MQQVPTLQRGLTFIWCLLSHNKCDTHSASTLASFLVHNLLPKLTLLITAEGWPSLLRAPLACTYSNNRFKAAMAALVSRCSASVNHGKEEVLLHMLAHLPADQYHTHWPQMAFKLGCSVQLQAVDATQSHL